jgi:hypothetical protein
VVTQPNPKWKTAASSDDGAKNVVPSVRFEPARPQRPPDPNEARRLAAPVYLDYTRAGQRSSLFEVSN